MNLATILDENSNVQPHAQLPLLPDEASTPSSSGRGRSSSNVGVMNRKCAYCDRRFSKAEHLKRHQRSHTGEKPFKCTVCLKSYARSDVLIRHTRNHHSDPLDGTAEPSNEKLKSIKSPESETSGSPGEEPASIAGNIMPQHSSSLNQPSRLPLQAHSDLQDMLQQSVPSFATSQQMTMTNQTPAQPSPHSQSLHRMSSQHDGSCLIEAALQAAGPSQTTPYPPTDQRPTPYHLSQRLQPQLPQPRNYTLPAMQDQSMYPGYSQPYPDLSHWLEACDVDMQPLPHGLDIWGDSAMMDFMGMDSAPSMPTPRPHHTHRPSFTKDVPDERFQRVERLWPIRKGTTSSRLGQTLCDQVIAHDQDSLFSDSALRPQHPYNLPARRTELSRWGLGEDCRARLVRDYGSSRSDNDIQDSFVAVENSDRASDVSLGSKFPPAEVLDMSLDLYFRRFHAFLPFAHRATFDAGSTSTSLLLPMCLIGLEVLDCEGSRKFIKAYLPVSLIFVATILLVLIKCVGCCGESPQRTNSKSSSIMSAISITDHTCVCDLAASNSRNKPYTRDRRTGTLPVFRSNIISTTARPSYSI